jgi:hypothetical protein
VYDSWIAAAEERHPSNAAAIRESYENQRTKVQGRTAAVFRVRAEEQRALELARQETDAALAMLRLFSKAMFFPTTRSYCAPLGLEHRGIEQWYRWRDVLTMARRNRWRTPWRHHGCWRAIFLEVHCIGR